MNHFRKVAEICKGIPEPVIGGKPLDKEAFDAGYAKGRHELAQEILSTLAQASKKIAKDGGDFSI